MEAERPKERHPKTGTRKESGTRSTQASTPRKEICTQGKKEIRSPSFLFLFNPTVS